MITREQIEARKVELIESRANVAANLNAHDAAIQECDRWLGMLREQATTEKPESKNEGKKSPADR